MKHYVIYQTASQYRINSSILVPATNECLKFDVFLPLCRPFSSRAAQSVFLEFGNIKTVLKLTTTSLS